jgi:hypothetical protein
MLIDLATRLVEVSSHYLGTLVALLFTIFFTVLMNLLRGGIVMPRPIV